MASITIRNIDDTVKQGLRMRAAKNGRSMEEEARQAILSHISQPGAHKIQTMRDVLKEVEKLVEKAGGFETVEYTDDYIDFTAHSPLDTQAFKS